MAPKYSVLFLLLLAFLLTCSPFTSANTLQDSEITFVQEPDANYNLAKDSVTIVCKARNANDITFTCAGTQIPPSSVEFETSQDERDIFEAKLKIEKSDVINFHKQKPNEPYWCQCKALDESGQIKAESRKGEITVNYLNSKFEIQPASAVVLEGDTAEIQCGAPSGYPKPEIIWRKNSRRIKFTPEGNLELVESGSLIIRNVTSEDAGNYQCVALNSVRRFESKTATLSVIDTAGSVMELDQDSQAENGKLRVPRQSSAPMFNVQPNKQYYLTPDAPAIMDCGTVGIDTLVFTCGGERIKKEFLSVKKGQNADGINLIQGQLNLTYNLISPKKGSDSKREDPVICKCTGYYLDQAQRKSWLFVDSEISQVFIAFLDDEFKVQPSDTVVAVNAVAVLKCEPPNGAPAPWISWYKDGNKIEVRSSNKYSVNEKGHLQIARAAAEDSGKYECVAESSAGTVRSRPAQLRVDALAEAPTTQKSVQEAPEAVTFPAEPPVEPKFTKYPDSSIEIEAGGSVTLTCEAVLVERMMVSCDNVRYKPDQVKSVIVPNPAARNQKVVSGKFSVTANQVTKAGYSCQCMGWFLRNKSWTSLTGQSFVISVKSDQPTVKPFLDSKFELSPTQAKVELGERHVFYCKPPKGYPEPEVSWYKDNSPIDSEDTNYHQENDGSLVIEEVREKDQGAYQCFARNEVGTKRTRVVRLVLATRKTTVRTTTTTTTATTTVTELPDTAEALAEPIFILDLPEQSFATEEMPAKLTCLASNTALLVFVCNDNLVPESHLNMQTMTVENDSVRENNLEISKDQLERFPDGSEYTCRCRAYYMPSGSTQYIDGNSTVITFQSGEREISTETVTSLPGAEITPEGEATSPKPFIAKDLHSEYYSVRNKPVTLTCEAVNVKSIYFECDGQEVQDTETQQALQSTDEEGMIVSTVVVASSIEVTRPEGDDDFVCYCFAPYMDEVTAEEKVLKSHPGMVKHAFLKKNFQNDPEDQTKSVGDFLSLACVPPIGNPAPTVTWTRNGDRLDGAVIGPDQSSLIIQEVSTNDEGEYVCHAENLAGKRSSKPARVTVQGKPTEEETTALVTDSVPDQKVNCAVELHRCFELTRCSEQELFENCIKSYTDFCTVTEELQSEIQSKQAQKREDCAAADCATINKCKGISSNQPETDQSSDILDLKYACQNKEDFVDCVNRELDICGVENGTDPQASFSLVNQYCSFVDFGVESVENCQTLRQCMIKPSNSRNTNVQWCSLTFFIHKCYAKALEECQIADSEIKKTTLAQINDVCQKVVASSTPAWETDTAKPGEPESEPQPEGEPEPAVEPTEGKTTREDDDGEDVGDGKTVESSLPEATTSKDMGNEDEEEEDTARATPMPKGSESEESEEDQSASKPSGSEDDKNSVKKDMSQNEVDKTEESANPETGPDDDDEDNEEDQSANKDEKNEEDGKPEPSANEDSPGE
ncbi:hemicentin-2-like isoform X1, partial [Biomphalaria pfeifferi]